MEYDSQVCFYLFSFPSELCFTLCLRLCLILIFCVVFSPGVQILVLLGLSSVYQRSYFLSGLLAPKEVSFATQLKCCYQMSHTCLCSLLVTFQYKLFPGYILVPLHLLYWSVISSHIQIRAEYFFHKSKMFFGFKTCSNIPVIMDTYCTQQLLH